MALTLFQDNRAEKLDSDFIVASLNLLSVMTEAFGPAMRDLAASSNLLGIMYRCMRENSRIRQETFALLGDLAPVMMPQITEVLNAYVPEILESIAPNHGRSSGNASWSLGRIIQHSDEQVIQPYALKMLEALKWVMCAKQVSRELMENSAISLGWLSYKVPAVVAPHLGDIFSGWCFALTEVIEGEDKLVAFFGMCKVIQANPGAIFNQNLHYFFNAVCSWDSLPDDLCKQFYLLLHEFRKSAPPAEWEKLLSAVDPIVRQKLTVYNI